MIRNPKLLCLLRKGCSITFPSDVILRGIVDRNFIETAMRDPYDLNMYVPIDLYVMDEKGLEEALQYEESVCDFLEEDPKVEKEYDEREDWQ